MKEKESRRQTPLQNHNDHFFGQRPKQSRIKNWGLEEKVRQAPIILYTILRKTRKAKIKRKLFGLSFRYFITAITISINIICLNILDLIYINYLLDHSLFSNLSETYISIFSKGVSSLIGLLWSSSMTILFAFDFKKSK